jgi:hypothetical protein
MLLQIIISNPKPVSGLRQFLPDKRLVSEYTLIYSDLRLMSKAGL